jgi:hypothetical protein
MQCAAQCQCGSLRAIASGEPRIINVCRCRSCQRRTGLVIHAGAYFLKADDVAWLDVNDRDRPGIVTVIVPGRLVRGGQHWRHETAGRPALPSSAMLSGCGKRTASACGTLPNNLPFQMDVFWLKVTRMVPKRRTKT